jgi:hypothetical protein
MTKTLRDDAIEDLARRLYFQHWHEVGDHWDVEDEEEKEHWLSQACGFFRHWSLATIDPEAVVELRKLRQDIEDLDAEYEKTVAGSERRADAVVCLCDVETAATLLEEDIADSILEQLE